MLPYHGRYHSLWLDLLCSPAVMTTRSGEVTSRDRASCGNDKRKVQRHEREQQEGDESGYNGECHSPYLNLSARRPHEAARVSRLRFLQKRTGEDKGH